ncbi:MAG: TetR/AcrR family transcriptional regulator [Tepidiformaceae bacterium]
MGRTKAQQSADTRARLIAVATRLFAEHGYAATSTEMVVREAGTTRGALYHQFRDKRELFVAVFEEAERQITWRVALAAASAGNRWEQFTAGCSAFLDASMEQVMRQVLLVDGRVVLGVEEWRRIMVGHGLGMTQAALEGLMAEGTIDEQPAEPLALLVMALLDEAAINAASSPDPQAARAQMGAVVARLLHGLRCER